MKLYFEGDTSDLGWLLQFGVITALRRTLEEKLMPMQEEINRLRAEVARNSTVVGSAIALITGLADQIRDAADDPDEVRTLADTLANTSNSMANAVAANTPAADEPAPQPAPEPQPEEGAGLPTSEDAG